MGFKFRNNDGYTTYYDLPFGWNMGVCFPGESVVYHFYNWNWPTHINITDGKYEIIDKNKRNKIELK